MGRHLNLGLSQSTLGLLKVEHYGSNAKRVNYWKCSGCDPQNLGEGELKI
jgi:hypothetical protein